MSILILWDFFYNVFFLQKNALEKKNFFLLEREEHVQVYLRKMSTRFALHSIFNHIKAVVWNSSLKLRLCCFYQKIIIWAGKQTMQTKGHENEAWKLFRSHFTAFKTYEFVKIVLATFYRTCQLNFPPSNLNGFIRS